MSQKVLWVSKWKFFLLIEAEWRIYASEHKTIIHSDNGLSPNRRQAITCTNDGILSIKP